MNRTLIFVSIAILALTGCRERPGQNAYKAGEVGISRAAEFGTILNVRPVDVIGENSGSGALAGAAAGAGGGSYVGRGDGNIWAIAGAAAAGALAGHFAEQAINDRTGQEYVVNLQSGETKIIVQEMHEGDIVFKPGDKVMIQYCDAGEASRRCADGKEYQRLLPVAKLPPYAKKRIKSFSKGEVEPAEF